MLPLDDISESNHANVADAMDFIGPGLNVLRTYTSSNKQSDVPKGWYVRKCQCYNKLCSAKIDIWSPTKDLDSSPAKVRIYGRSHHLKHGPIQWMDWYEYRQSNDPNGNDWNQLNYPRRPGLPFFIQLALRDTLLVNPHIGPAAAARVIQTKFNCHPLFINPGKVTELIIGQIKASVRGLKKRPGVVTSTPTVKRMHYTGDIWEYIQLHRINYDKLKDMRWVAQLRRGPQWIRAMALSLQHSGVVCGLGMYEKLPERDLIVLDSDEVPQNERWQWLKTANDKVHRTGPDPRRRTVVFSSLALLANAVWCQDMKWEVCASVDGTHGMSRSSYKLITLGVYGFSQSRMSRTFHPLVYIWGEGEREIVALHGFLNFKIAIHTLFGIKDVCFRGGIVSDATTVFTNAVSVAFPGTPLLSCYPHIIRKFKVDDRSGNGHYAANLSRQTRQWLVSEAEPAIRRCSLCKTKQQWDKMWQLTKDRWQTDGETKLATTFAKTYIDEPNFSNWFYKASGFHGCVPCNNPMERHNLSVKGSPNFFGYIEIGRDMYNCLTQEFVKLVYTSSTELCSPSSGLPVLDFRKATSNDHFMQFQSLINDSVDIRQYKDGWLMNDIDYLTEPITQVHVVEMELAMVGVVNDAHRTSEELDIRDVLLNRTKRFHFVRDALWQLGGVSTRYFECDCRHYYFHRWCFQSAYMQHREKLHLLGQKISRGSVSSQTKQTKSMKVAKALQTARDKLRSRGNVATAVNHLAGTHVLTQDDEDTHVFPSTNDNAHNH
jgi:hypothetical protein